MAMLALYYLLVVNYGWSDHRVSTIGWRFHVLPWGYAIISSIFAAVTDLYRPVTWTCWMNFEGALGDLSSIQRGF
eukprot:10239034-Ditylum_brightwellii.AAC.1